MDWAAVHPGSRSCSARRIFCTPTEAGKGSILGLPAFYGGDFSVPVFPSDQNSPVRVVCCRHSSLCGRHPAACGYRLPLCGPVRKRVQPKRYLPVVTQSDVYSIFYHISGMRPAHTVPVAARFCAELPDLCPLDHPFRRKMVQRAVRQGVFAVYEAGTALSLKQNRFSGRSTGAGRVEAAPAVLTNQAAAPAKTAGCGTPTKAQTGPQTFGAAIFCAKGSLGR